MKFATADLCDLSPEAQVAAPVFRDYGGVSTFYGPMTVLKVFEDNALIRTLLSERGDGRVLVIDGGGSMRCALVGGNLAQLAIDQDWRGIVVNGCVRDAAELQTVAIGIKALGTHPRRSEKGLHTGHRDRPVSFANVMFRSGQWLYADPDGIVVSDRPLHS
jgi:regulator of ribonuclease activity A